MNVLAYVAYFFPPLGGAGVQRSLKFARYLPANGWLPKVITIREGHYWMRDPSLMDEVPPDVEVVRTEALTGHAILAWLGARRAVGELNARRSGSAQRKLRGLSRWLAIPDPFVGWIPHATRAARRILDENGGVLMTTSSPDSAHLVGLRIPAVRRLAIAWVVDFRDPWVRRMSFDPPSGLHRRIQEYLEHRVIRAATRVVTTSDATRADFLKRHPDCPPERIVVIPNGYDEEDFPPILPAPDPGFGILHLGQLNPERPVKPLGDAIEAFLNLRPAARAETRVDLVGPRYVEDEREVARRGLGGIVRFHDSVPHRDAVLRLARARVLLLLEQESDRGALILPGKVFEYLRAGRPILGIVPRGAAWDLVTRLGAGECALPSEPRRAASALARIYDEYRAGSGPAPRVDGDEIRSFERRALTSRLASVLDEAAALCRPPRS